MTLNYDSVFLNKETYSLNDGNSTHSIKELYVEGWPDADVIPAGAVIEAAAIPARKFA